MRVVRPNVALHAHTAVARDCVAKYSFLLGRVL